MRTLPTVRSSTPVSGTAAGSSVRSHALKAADDRRGRLLDLRLLLAPDARNLFEDLDEARPSPSSFGRKVGAAVERLETRRQPDAHRPPARSGRRLDERHVDAVHVRALFAVDLDRHEVARQHLGDRGVLEALVLHHMAPVARRVADREEDRLVLLACAVEGILTPGVPVDRVVLVLEEVGALFCGETIRHSSDYPRARRAIAREWALTDRYRALSRVPPRCRDSCAERLSMRSCGEGWLERNASTLL